jgi:Fe-S-cluster-containing hydrogenase component 2
VDAIQIENGLAAVSMSKCIGCGLCVSTCPNDSISMIHKKPDAISHIYGNDFELMQARAKDTNRPYPFE